MKSKNKFVLTLFTNDIQLARQADLAGINRIGVDLEKIGKRKRQGHLNSWISDHSVQDILRLLDVLTEAALFVRTNPIHPGSREEIDLFIQWGAEVIMLPMFRTVEEVEKFVRYVDGRAQVSLLVETGAAVARIHEIVKVGGIDEIHVGLNDLYLDLQLENHFEVLASGMMELLSTTVRQAGIPFGFGGVGRLGDKRLIVPADLVYAQYPRLEADRALVSRAFFNPDYVTLDIPHEVSVFRHRMNQWCNCTKQELEQAHQILRVMSRSLQL